MTDKTDIKALRPSERTKLGFVTDDNTGGYYVAECEECGKIFPSQTCNGGGAIADTGDYGDCYCPHCGHVDPNECDNANHVWNVQQLIIINLTSQLEAERQQRELLEVRVRNVEAELKTPHRAVNTLSMEFAALHERCVAAEAQVKELEALKGEQVPVALIDERTVLGFMLTKRGRELNMPHGTELFTAPQKPVVLPEPISISDVILKVDAEQNAKWNGRIGFMAGWNACRDAAGSVAKESK